MKDGDGSAVARRGVLTSDSYHQAVDLALELAHGKPVFSLNADTGKWAEISRRHSA
jgi:hypothetical protein